MVQAQCCSFFLPTELNKMLLIFKVFTSISPYLFLQTEDSNLKNLYRYAYKQSVHFIHSPEFTILPFSPNLILHLTKNEWPGMKQHQVRPRSIFYHPTHCLQLNKNTNTFWIPGRRKTNRKTPNWCIKSHLVHKNVFIQLSCKCHPIRHTSDCSPH